MDFGELKNDTNFVENITQFSACLNKIDEQVNKCVEFPHYEKLTAEEKIKYDLYLSYTMNSLYWMYVKLQGADPNEHGIKNEISRVRQAMLRDKQIYESKTLRPTVNKDVAGRFIKHGIHYREKKNQNDDKVESQGQQEPGKFVKINKRKDVMDIDISDDENKDQSTNTSNINSINISSDDSDDKPPAKKVKTNTNESDNIIQISDNESIEESAIKKKKKKKKKKNVIEIDT